MDAFDADLAAFLLQYGGDLLGPVALMAAVEDSLHVFHGLLLVYYEPWRVSLLAVDDCAMLDAKGFTHEADAEPLRLVAHDPLYFRNLDPVMGVHSAVD